ncbi:MAG: hypothetical protein CMJ74_02610 [Planctomycetaceae bacterium]|nr:hypothetical protein [Planctomycetaceae bacterium]|tara:strand:+ start:471 stop:659 length:189 start_codon:yes stop_codon:yes gene_type:complete
MRPKKELEEIIDQIASSQSPVGMDAVYVHALILDKLQAIENRLTQLEGKLQTSVSNDNSNKG